MDTVIEAVVAPVLHNNEPVYEPAVRVVLPQVFTTVTVGAGTFEATGAAVPTPNGPVHPFIVWETL